MSIRDDINKNFGKCGRCKQDMYGCECDRYHPEASAPIQKAHSIYENFEWEHGYGFTRQDND